MDAGMKNGDTTRYLLINAWAWKAVGVVELVSIHILNELSFLITSEESTQISGGHSMFPNRVKG